MLLVQSLHMYMHNLVKYLLIQYVYFYRCFQANMVRIGTPSLSYLHCSGQMPSGRCGNGSVVQLVVAEVAEVVVVQVALLRIAAEAVVCGVITASLARAVPVFVTP